LYDYLPKAYKALRSLIEKDTDPDGFSTSCSEPIEKWSLGDYDTVEVTGKPSINSVTLARFRIVLNPKISSYERKTTGFLNVIAAVGGFTNVMTKIFKIFGTYFSTKFINQSMVSSFYLTKKSKKKTSIFDAKDLNKN